MSDVAADLRARRRLLPHDPTRNVQGKREFVEHATGRPNPVERRLSDIEAEVHGDTAITSGALEIHYSPERKREPHRMRHLRVYRLRDATWRPICHRTLPAAEAR